MQKLCDHNKPLFVWFLWNLEGKVAQWYKENIGPKSMNDFDKVINTFIKKYEVNLSVTPAMDTLMSLYHELGEPTQEYIQKVVFYDQQVMDPMPKEHLLTLILKRF